MRTAKVLTAKRIERLTSANQGKLGHHRDAEIRGLYLQVARLAELNRPPSASWLLRFQIHGRERMMGLGSLHDVDLEEARKRARAARLQLSEGINPLDEKNATKEARQAEAARNVTFEQAALKYYEAQSNTWKSKIHRDQILSSLKRHAFPMIGNVPVAKVDTPLVKSVLDPIWFKIPDSASRLRSRIESVLDFATVSGWRTGPNPAAWKGHLELILSKPSDNAKVVHHPAMPHADLPTFMIELRKRVGSAARALEFTILTAARTSEVTLATWDEIDFRERLWTVPADRMKMKIVHRVPLTDRAIALLEALPREDGNPHLFIGMKKGRGLSNMSMAVLMNTRMGFDTITVHGFRSCFRDWVADCTNVQDKVAEQALAHSLEGRSILW